MADDEGSDEEGGKGDGNGDEGGGRATATTVKKRARAARAMVTRVVGDEEGGGDGGNMARNNDDGLVPVVLQQAVLYSASASIDNVGDDKSTGRRLAYALRTDDVGVGMSRAIKRFVDWPMEGHRTQKGHLSYWRITQLRTD